MCISLGFNGARKVFWHSTLTKGENMKKQQQELEQESDSAKTILGDQKGAVATATPAPKASSSRSRFTDFNTSPPTIICSDG